MLPRLFKTLFAICSLLLFTGCLGPKVTPCVLDVDRLKAICAPPDNEPVEVELASLRNYACLSPEDWNKLLKWIEQHRK